MSLDGRTMITNENTIKTNMLELFHTAITLSKILQNLTSGLKHDHKTSEISH